MNSTAVSFRQTIVDPLTSLLEEAGFTITESLLDGVMWTIDALQSYTEEGRHLYPEVIVTTSISDLAKPLGYHRLLKIGSTSMQDAFATALKVCAPLAVGDWAIWIELSGTTVTYGVLSAAASELSPTLRNQLVGDLAVEESGAVPTLYVRATGGKTVELSSRQRQLSVPSGLVDIDTGIHDLEHFIDNLTYRIPAGRRTIARSFLQKAIGEAARQTHGCMLAVISAGDSTISEGKAKLLDGIYFEPPIDLMELLEDSDRMRSREASTRVRAYVDLLMGMVSQDGITLFSDDGRILGYRVFVPIPDGLEVLGGARRRAFSALDNLKVCTCVFAMSHDGATSFSGTSNDE